MELFQRGWEVEVSLVRDKAIRGVSEAFYKHFLAQNEDWPSLDLEHLGSYLKRRQEQLESQQKEQNEVCLEHFLVLGKKLGLKRTNALQSSHEAETLS